MKNLLVLENEIKQLVIDALSLEDLSVADIKAEDALFVDGLGLDSIDALELGVAIKKKYNIKINADDAESKKYFYSVKTLAEFINKNL